MVEFINREDAINYRSLKDEQKRLKEDMSDMSICSQTSESQLLLWVEELQSINTVINALLRNAERKKSIEYRE